MEDLEYEPSVYTMPQDARLFLITPQVSMNGTRESANGTLKDR